MTYFDSKSAAEDFVRWFSGQVTVTGNKLPNEKEWAVILEKLKEASQWLHPWYLGPGSDEDGGGGENIVPHFSTTSPTYGRPNIH